MAEYVLDRFNGVNWVTMMISSEPIHPDMFSEPRAFPFDPNYPAFAGAPGYKLRIRYVDVTTDMELELYDWDKIPSNPHDETSDLVWGWKCTKRGKYPSTSQSPEFMRVGVSW